ncbi:MAG: hypothetical protein NC110_00640 [Ruminococcus sp.]|nr:hypothetical protein [Ruminococcus sp.]
MKKKPAIITSIILALCILCAVAVTAIDSVTTPKIPVEKCKTYYAYYNEASAKGAVAFSLNNQFTSFGKSEKDLVLCTQNAEGNYVAVYTIPREAVSVWFAGKTEVNVYSNENGCQLLGGLSAIGFTADSTKTNIAFSLNSQSISGGTNYYVYVPDNYFADAAGVGNAGGYVMIEAEKVNSYTGDLLSDLQTAAQKVYDVAIWGVESVAGLLGQ